LLKVKKQHPIIKKNNYEKAVLTVQRRQSISCDDYYAKATAKGALAAFRRQSE